MKSVEVRAPRQKDYERKETGNKGVLLEEAEVDPTFVAGGPVGGDEVRIPFDAYLIAEGGWSHSTRRLGFRKLVTQRSRSLGLVPRGAKNGPEGVLGSPTFSVLSIVVLWI